MLARLWLGALVLLAAVRVVGLEHGPLLVLLVGALPVTLLPAYALLVGFALRRRWRAALVAAAVVAVHVVVVVPTQRTVPAGEGRPLRVVTANLYVLNEMPEQAGRVLRALRPDVLVVPELDVDGLEGLRAAGLLDDLPFVMAPFDGRAETVGLLSRFPLRDQEVRRSGGRALPRATVAVGGRDLRLVGHHPFPPVHGFERLWRESLSDLRRDVEATDLPVVVAGDLNADRDHAVFRRLLDVGLRDAHDERGRGLVRTWPAVLPLLHLDHVLVRDGTAAGIGVADVSEERIPGSDHLAVVADLVVQPSR